MSETKPQGFIEQHDLPGPVFERSFHVRLYETDFQGRVRTTALLNYLQEAAGEHAHLLGVAVGDLMRMGLTWVLSRMHLEICAPIGYRSRVTIRTWPSTREGRFSCREFQAFDPAGNLLARATSSFAALDLATRRPVMLDERLPTYPLLPTRAIDDSFPTLPRLEDPESELSFRVRRSDLDMNRHANNVSFAGWALEAIPGELADGALLAGIEIAFRAETFAGERITVGTKTDIVDEQPVCLQRIGGDDGRELARVRSRWKRV